MAERIKPTRSGLFAIELLIAVGVFSLRALGRQLGQVPLPVRRGQGQHCEYRQAQHYTGGWETDDTLDLWSGDIY